MTAAVIQPWEMQIDEDRFPHCERFSAACLVVQQDEEVKEAMLTAAY